MAVSVVVTDVSVDGGKLPHGSKNETEENLAKATGTITVTLDQAGGTVDIEGTVINIKTDGTSDDATNANVATTNGKVKIDSCSSSDEGVTSVLGYTYTLDTAKGKETTDSAAVSVTSAGEVDPKTASDTIVVTITPEVEEPEEEPEEEPDLATASLTEIATAARNKMKEDGIITEKDLKVTVDPRKTVKDYAALYLGIMDVPWGAVSELVKAHIEASKEDE